MIKDHGKDRDLIWELIDSREDQNYQLFSVRINKNRSPRTGEIHEFQVLTSFEWVAVIPLTPDQQVVMVRQYRHGTGEISLEVPGGVVKPGTTPEQGAQEELEEETGYIGNNMVSLGWMYPVPALFTNRMYVFYTLNAEPSGILKPDETEALQTVLVPLYQVKKLIREGTINNALMVAALYRFLDHFENARDKIP